MAHIRQSRPDYGLGFEVDVLTAFQVFPFSLGSGEEAHPRTGFGVAHWVLVGGLGP